jgi:hypothetical protein
LADQVAAINAEVNGKVSSPRTWLRVRVKVRVRVRLGLG